MAKDNIIKIINPKQKFYFSITTVLIILAILILGVAFPLMKKIKNNAHDYLEGKKSLLAMEREIGEVKLLEKRYQEIKEASLKLETVFLDPAETLGFITSLEKLVEETNNSFSITAVSVAEKEKFINFQIMIAGNFSNLIHFLTGLEDIPYPPYRLVGIENVDIRKISDENIQANLGIKVYTK